MFDPNIFYLNQRMCKAPTHGLLMQVNPTTYLAHCWQFLFPKLLIGLPPPSTVEIRDNNLTVMLIHACIMLLTDNAAPPLHALH
jgi:hypothetical protein